MKRRGEVSEAEEQETGRHGRAVRKNKSNAPRRIPLLLSRRFVCFASNVLAKTEKGPAGGAKPPTPCPPTDNFWCCASNQSCQNVHTLTANELIWGFFHVFIYLFILKFDAQLIPMQMECVDLLPSKVMGTVWYAIKA